MQRLFFLVFFVIFSQQAFAFDCKTLLGKTQFQLQPSEHQFLRHLKLKIRSEMARAPRGQKFVAAFDWDGTLFSTNGRGDTGRIFPQQILEQGFNLENAHVQDLFTAGSPEAMWKTVLQEDFDLSARVLAKFLAGKKREDVHHFALTHLQDQINRHHSLLLELIGFLDQLGVQVVILTASPKEIIFPLAQPLGFAHEEIIGTELIRHHKGHFVDKLKTPIPVGEGKWPALQALMDEDTVLLFGAGNTGHDFPFMREARIGLVVQGAPKDQYDYHSELELVQMAQQMSSKILVFRPKTTFIVD